MKERQNDFLRDFATLLKRHPSKEWTRLANLLEDSNARSQIILFLRGVAGPEQVSSKPKEQKARKVKSQRDKNSKREYVELLDLELSRRSMSELRDLARRRGLRFSMKDSKERLVRLLLRSPYGSRARISRSLEKPKEDSSEYAQWAEIIMGRTRE